MSRRRPSRFQNEQMSTFVTACIIVALGVLVAALTIITNWYNDNKIATIIIFLIILIFLVAVVLFNFGLLASKEMTYVVSHASIIDTRQQQATVPTFLPGLEVTYKGQPEKTLYLVLVEFHNKGNTRIVLDDYIGEGITIKFKSDTRILDASIKGMSNQTVVYQASASSFNTTILIRKFEWEPDKAITLRVFLDVENYDIEIDQQDLKFPIRKVDDANEKNQKVIQKLEIFSYIITAILLTCSLVALFFVLPIPPKINLWVLLFLAVITVLCVGIIIGKLYSSFILSRQSKI